LLEAAEAAGFSSRGPDFKAAAPPDPDELLDRELEREFERRELERELEHL